MINQYVSSFLYLFLLQTDAVFSPDGKRVVLGCHGPATPIKYLAVLNGEQLAKSESPPPILIDRRVKSIDR